jgi:Dyp-type peroxidase family
MYTQKPAREAPVPHLLQPQPDLSHPSVPYEPVLNIENIQGNNLAGFNKDFQTFLFLKIVDVHDFKHWLKSVVPFIATAAEVLAFNRLFKEIRKRRGESRAVQATWINIAFSFNAITQLTDDADAFEDEAFKQGLAARSEELGDPTEPDAEGNKHNWVFGGPHNEADVMLIVASDDRNDLFAEVARIEDSIYAARTPDGKPTSSGVQIIYKQHGATLPPPLKGHEHFGFLDGVSQPGLRGRLSENHYDVLTPRQNPNNPNQGKPGQDLLWPGEFVFGYPGQDGNKEVEEPGDIVNAGPAWAKDGSFLVMRRLRQDVPGFKKFQHETAKQLGIESGLFGAKCVGRWASGAPIMLAPEKDDKKLADNDCANNNFEFRGEGETEANKAEHKPHQNKQGEGLCPGNLPEAPPDREGKICPFAGHIRKAYPRDDEFESGEGLNESSTQTHRLLRRGIPFGDPYQPSEDPSAKDSGDRGLLFLAYQTSIVDQFEFVTKLWVNNPDFKEPGSGHDPILGQNNTPGENRQRKFKLTFKTQDGSDRTTEVCLDADWVIPTGGGYFFSPSIAALNLFSKTQSTAHQELTPEEYTAAVEENIPDRD